MKRTSLVTSRVTGRAAAAAGAALVLSLTGCGYLNPSTSTEPYDAADGVSADLSGGTLALRNFLVVGAEKGEPGVVVGAIANTGTEAAVVSFTADLAESTQPTETRIRVPAGQLVQLGGADGQEFLVPELPVAPGQTIQLSAATDGGGSVNLSAPVLPPDGDYAGITPPAPSPTPSGTPSPSVTADGDTGDQGTGSGGEAEEPEATPTPSESATDQ